MFSIEVKRGIAKIGNREQRKRVIDMESRNDRNLKEGTLNDWKLFIEIKRAIAENTLRIAMWISVITWESRNSRKKWTRTSKHRKWTIEQWKKVLSWTPKSNRLKSRSIGTDETRFQFYKNLSILVALQILDLNLRRAEIEHMGIGGSGIRSRASRCSKMSPQLCSNRGHIMQRGPVDL